MGSSAKKKREKKKDFQKPKLKVGKARPKAANQTDTSFKAKAIVLNQQLNVEAPSISSQFLHHVSLLSSRSDSQRRESLAYLTTFLTTTSTKSLVPTTSSSLLDKLCPLILDGTGSVRAQLLKVFQAVPKADVQDSVSKILPYVRAGMTHLSKDVRLSAIDYLSWLMTVAGSQVVSCPGGWFRTLDCFTTVLGWRSLETAKWSSNKVSLGDARSTARIIAVLSEFLDVGLSDRSLPTLSDTMAMSFPLWHVDYNAIPTKSNVYASLELFGPPRDEEGQMLEDTEGRIRVYREKFSPMVEIGIAACKQEGGELGRAAGTMVKVLDKISRT